MNASPVSGKELLQRIRPTRREEKTQLCLRPDLLDRHEALTEQLLEAQSSQGPRLGGSGGTSKTSKALAKEIEALEQEIMDHSMWFTMRAVDKATWQSICDRHPPREEFINDLYAGYNTDAVLDDAIRACLVDPVFEDCEDPGCEHDACGSWQNLEKVLNHSEWEELRATVNSVNRSVVEPPKSQLASLVLAPRSSASGRPAPTE